jgi:hypothetical protein
MARSSVPTATCCASSRNDVKLISYGNNANIVLRRVTALVSSHALASRDGSYLSAKPSYCSTSQRMLVRIEPKLDRIAHRQMSHSRPRSATTVLAACLQHQCDASCFGCCQSHYRCPSRPEAQTAYPGFHPCGRTCEARSRRSTAAGSVTWWVTATSDPSRVPPAHCTQMVAASGAIPRF